MHSARKIGRAGFSLTELVLVLSLLGIMTGVYLTAYSPTAASLDRAVRRLESDLRYVQELSVNEERNYGMKTIGQTAYYIYELNSNTLITDPHTRQPHTVNFPTEYRGVSFANVYQVAFDLTGRPTAGTYTIRLQQGNRFRTLTINGMTGLMQVQ